MVLAIALILGLQRKGMAQPQEVSDEWEIVVADTVLDTSYDRVDPICAVLARNGVHGRAVPIFWTCYVGIPKSYRVKCRWTKAAHLRKVVISDAKRKGYGSWLLPAELRRITPNDLQLDLRNRQEGFGKESKF